MKIIDKITIELFCFLTASKEHKPNSLFYKFKSFGLSAMFRENEPKILDSLNKYLFSDKGKMSSILLKSLTNILGVEHHQTSQNKTLFDASKLFKNYYADIADLKSDYRRLANKYHPDKFDSLDNEFQQLAHNRFIAIKDYYEYRLSSFTPF